MCPFDTCKSDGTLIQFLLDDNFMDYLCYKHHIDLSQERTEFKDARQKLQNECVNTFVLYFNQATCDICKMETDCLECNYHVKLEKSIPNKINIVIRCDTCKKMFHRGTCEICKYPSCSCGHPCGCTCSW